MMQRQNKNRHDIQFLRAFAVLSVIAYHFKVIAGGFIGVDIFFVISGFLVSNQIRSKLNNKNFSFKSFFEARVRRIFPALVFLCLIIAIWGWFFEVPRHYLGTIRNLISALFFVSNYAFNGAHGYFDIASETKVLLHSWSLSIEAQFYILLPILLFLNYKFLKNKSELILITLFILSLIFSFQAESKGFYLLSSRAWEFLAGALLINPSLKSFIKYRHATPFFLFAGLLTSTLIISNQMNWPNFITLIPVLLTLAFIITMKDSQDHFMIANSPMQLIGNISYSLYLWHWPVFVLANQFFENEITIYIKLGLLIFVFLISYLSWRYIEKPFRDKERVSTKMLINLMIFILLATSVFTIFIIKTRGYPGRLKDFAARPSIQAGENTPRVECFIDRKHNMPQKLCTFGASSKPEDADLILWGDSNANQYVTALTKASASSSTTGLIATMASCQSYIPAHISIAIDIECHKFNDKILKYITDSKNIDIVVIGRDYGGKNISINETVFLAKNLISAGKKVILLGPIPKSNMDVEYIWTIRQIKLGQPIENIQLNSNENTAQFLIFNTLSDQLFHEIQQGKLVLINPLTKLCKESLCYAVKDGVAIFRDQNHLTEIIAQSFESDFKVALDKLLRK